MPAMPNRVEGYYFEMPPMPAMPEMPAMPDLQALEIEQLMNADQLKAIENLDELLVLNDARLRNIEVFMDSSDDGASRVIVISNGDSTVICSPKIKWSRDASEMYLNGQPFMIMGDDLLEQQEAFRAQAEEMRKQQQAWREQSREMQDAYRKEQNQLRKEYRGQLSWTEDDRQAMERDLALEGNVILRYAPQPRLSLSDQMVSDGLIEPGAEVEVQLTPDKLKINGEKMPESIHQKYLELYEQQQGMELTGNSRVEFTTKSKQRM